MNEPSVACFLGDTNVDVLLPIDVYPEVGGDKRSERMVLESGGSAANSAAALARFGHRALLLSCVGIDPFGELALHRLGGAGVELTAVRRTDQDDTGLMFVPVTETGQRTLFGRRGANRLLRASDISPQTIVSSHALHLSGYAFLESPQREAAQHALAACSQAGILISMDTAYEPPLTRPVPIREAINQVNLLILGEEEAKALAGKPSLEPAIADIFSAGPTRIALKRGARGSVLFEGSERVEVPAFRVETVDTTGAGDAFSGALLAGLLWGLDFISAGIMASAAGALVTTVWGAGPRSPRPTEVLNLIQEGTLPSALHPAAEKVAIMIRSLQ
jgi:ribokinase